MNKEDVIEAVENILKEDPKLGRKKDYIIRDVIEQLILRELYSIPEFKEKFAFKGGTAIAKCYLNYHRFSVDLDFTYAKAYEEIEEKYTAMNQRKKAYDKMRRYVGQTLQNVANNLKDAGILFEYDPKDIKKVQMKFNKRVVTYTFELDYPEIPDKKLKVEMNFSEKLYYKPVKVVAKTYGGIVYGEYEPVEVLTYHPKELLIEKYKASLSRTIWKDFFDAYFLYKRYGIEPMEVKDIIVDKLIPLMCADRIKGNTLKSLEKYSSGMVTPEFVYEDMKRSYGDLRLAPIPPDFDNFVQRTVEQLHEIGKEILSQIEEKEEEEDMEIEP